MAFKKAEERRDDRKAAKAEKGKEPWRFKLISGSEHPDNKPPVTIIAEASDEAKEKYEASINAEREKQFAPGADWRELEAEKEDKDEEDNGKNNKK